MFTTIPKVSARTLPVLAMTVLLVQNHAQVTVVPRALTGFQIPTKDPRATALLTFSITAMSGGARRSLSSCDATFQTTQPDGSADMGTERWSDNWSAGVLIFSHEQVNSSGVHTISADAQNNVQDIEPSGTQRLPRELQHISMPWQVPVAIFQMELNNPVYKIEYLGLKNSNVVIRVTQITPNGFADVNSIETWRINPVTGTPASAMFSTIDLESRRAVLQRVEYGAYMLDKGLMVPSSLLFNSPGHAIQFTTQSITCK